MQNSKLELKHRSYLYALKIISFLKTLSNDYVTRIIGQQLLRSSTSIGANIIEAQAASSRKDFINFFNYALKSANESKFWLGLLRDSKSADFKVVEELLKETNELANILGASVLTAKGKR